MFSGNNPNLSLELSSAGPAGAPWNGSNGMRGAPGQTSVSRDDDSLREGMACFKHGEQRDQDCSMGAYLRRLNMIADVANVT